jgi:UDP-N-acetylmuramyl pentapeptide phosphotransferase/UDP-N-acetylglucosamine-1-phosphate transferase
MYLHFLYLIVFLFSVVTARIILPEVISISYEKNLMDIPSGRKLHHNPVPRLGGITFFPIVLMSVMLFNGLCVLWLGARLSVSDTRSFLMMQFFTIGVVMMYLVGTADDLVGVNYRIKFCFQILAAALLPISGLWVHTFYGLFGIYEIPAWFGIPFTIFLTVYITNAINLIDGVDGLASGISILALCLYAAVFIFLNVPVYVTFCLATLGVLLVFFYFNVFAGFGGTRVVKYSWVMQAVSPSATSSVLSSFLCRISIPTVSVSSEVPSLWLLPRSSFLFSMWYVWSLPAIGITSPCSSPITGTSTTNSCVQASPPIG